MQPFGTSEARKAPFPIILTLEHKRLKQCYALQLPSGT